LRLQLLLEFTSDESSDVYALFAELLGFPPTSVGQLPHTRFEDWLADQKSVTEYRSILQTSFIHRLPFLAAQEPPKLPTLTKVIEGHLTKSIPKAVTPSVLCQMLYGPHESASENRDVLWRKTLECVQRETARRSARREPCTASCGADAGDQNLTRKQTICAHHCGEGRTAETATGSGD
jgi:hypothetical protein